MIDLSTAVALGVAASVIGLIFALRQRSYVLAQASGTQRMQEIAAAIERGAGAFLQREYRAVAILVAIVTVALVVLSSAPGSGMSVYTAVAFVIGALASGLSGYIGMYIAVRANVRTAQAASQSLNMGLRVAFASGTVMSTMVVSLALLGISLLFILFVNQLDSTAQAASALAGFGFGGTSIAIFARVGGGIYTKAADVGADLVGKTEAGIPEDDPRNPATIADNVGDNVGDVAGMGSDLFESYASSIIAAISLATTAGIFVDDGMLAAQVFPLLVAAAGLIVSIIASFLVKTEEGADQEQLLGSIRKGIYSASALIGVVVIALGSSLPFGDLASGVIIATLSGLVGGVLIGYFTEYFTADTYGPTQALSASAKGGAGIVVIRGLALGMMSTLAPVLIVVAVTLLATSQAGLYGVAVAAVGMLSTLGITLATDAYGPVADNAGGIAEMSDLPESVRERTDALDSLGNTTAATGKGFAIGSAAMTALALTAAFITALTAGGSTALGAAVNPAELLLSPQFVTGLFIGGLLPFVFSALTMVAVGDAAQQIVEEVRRQFRELGIMGRQGAAGLRALRSHQHGQRHPPDAAAGHHRGGRAGGHGAAGGAGQGQRPGRFRGADFAGGRAAGFAGVGIHAGGDDGECRRRLGQRQKTYRSGQSGRQRLGCAQGGGCRRHRRRPIQGYIRSVSEYPAEAAGDCVTGHRAANWQRLPADVAAANKGRW